MAAWRFAIGVMALNGSAWAAPPVVAPKPADSGAVMPVVGCESCRFLTPPTQSQPLLPVEDGPVLAPRDDRPEPLPLDTEATPLSPADRAVDLRDLIDQSLPEATDDERRVWLDELQGLPPHIARDILSARLPALVPHPLPDPNVPETADIPDQPPLQSEPPMPDSATSNRDSSPKSDAAAGLAVTLETLRNVESVHLHNIANAATPGFKRLQPVPIAAPGVGGLAGSHARRMMHAGSIEETGQPFDVAIDGEGYFQVRRGDVVALTRGGRLARTEAGELAIEIDDEYWTLHPTVLLSDEATQFIVTTEGVVGYTLAGHGLIQCGQIHLARVLDPAQLELVETGLLAVPPAAGAPTVGLPGSDGFGDLRQGCLEGSNVDLAQELRALQRIRRQREALESATTPMLAAPPQQRPQR